MASAGATCVFGIGLTILPPVPTRFFTPCFPASVNNPTVVFTPICVPVLFTTVLACFRVFFSALVSVEKVPDFKSLLIAVLAPSTIVFAVFPPRTEPAASITAELIGFSPAIVVVPFEAVMSIAASVATTVAIVAVLATAENQGIATAPTTADAPTLVQSILLAASQKPCPCIVILAVI